MKPLHTHYDNLKVARNAPDSVIRAAYKTLSQTYHPDKNPGNTRAAEVMKLLNTAYGVLSDPAKRREHDAWIERQEERRYREAYGSRQSEPESEPARPRPEPEPKPQPRPQPRPAPAREAPRQSAAAGAARSLKSLTFSLVRGFGPLLLILGGLWAMAEWSDNQPAPAGPKPYTAGPLGTAGDPSATLIGDSEAATAGVADVPDAPAWVRPGSAPNGRPWPTRAGYLAGELKRHTDGLSEVTVDNGQNDADVHVKLVAIADQEAYPVREFFIPAGQRFTVSTVDAGQYDVRYRDLDSGSLSRSEAFELKETPTEGGTQYSSIEMTLYKVANGNMQSYELGEQEF